MLGSIVVCSYIMIDHLCGEYEVYPLSLKVNEQILVGGWVGEWVCVSMNISEWISDAYCSFTSFQELFPICRPLHMYSKQALVV